VGALKANHVAFNAGSLFNYEYNSDQLNADLLNTSDGLSIGSNVGINLLNLASSPLPLDTKLTLISYAGPWNGGTFTGFPNSHQFSYSGNDFELRYDDTPAGSLNGGAFASAVTLRALTGPIPTTVNGFKQYYAPENWATEPSSHGGSINTAGAPETIVIEGPNGNIAAPDQIGFLITIPVAGNLEFDWLYTSIDSPPWDAAYFVNNTEFPLGNTNGQSGHIAVPVNAGDTIGWRVKSLDSIFGAGVLTINNFSAPAPGFAAVPEPATGGLVGLSICCALCAVHRRDNRS
jgi:hypothetical protein